MVTFYPKFYLTLGTAGNSSIYIKDSNGEWQEFINHSYFKVVKKQNQVSEFEIHIMDLEDAEKLYVKEFAEVMFFSETNSILKGRIQKITYKTAYEATIVGFGMEAKLLEKELIKAGDKRVQYTNESAQTVANEILSSNTDGSSPWIITPNTTGLFDTDYGNVSIRYEYGNRLNSIAKLTEAIDYEWDVSQEDTYFDDLFNIAPLLPDATRATVSQETFQITGVDANCYQTNKEIDITNLANKIDALGYGDGVNQKHTSTYNASETYSTLASDITASSTTITLADASSFDSSGEIRIMEERITYSGKSGNDLTGCTRGANSTTALIHKKNIYVEKYIAITSAESGSSIGTNGLMDYTVTARDILDVETLELIASRKLLERMNPIVRISVLPNEPLETAGSRKIGDLITITDAESDLSGDYRIVGITYISNYGDLYLEIEASNKSLTFIEQMQKQREANENLSKYMQGATNTNQVLLAENCDTNYNLDLRFYIPSDAKAINKLRLNYKIKPYRIYHTSVPSGGGHTTASGGGHTTPNGGGHTTPSGGGHTTPSGGGSTSGSTAVGSTVDSDSGTGVSCSSGSWTTVASCNTSNSGARLLANVYIEGSSGGAEDIGVRIVNSGESTATGGRTETYMDGFRDISVWRLDGVFAGMDGSSDSVSVQVYPHTGEITVDGYLSIYKQDHTHSTPSHSHTVSNHTHTVESHNHTVSNHAHTVSDHSHSINYGISETASACSDVAVHIETSDGGGFTNCTSNLESEYGTLSTSGEQDLDLINFSGVTFASGNWVTISIRPTGKCRIEGSNYTQVFIESTSD